MRRAYSRREFLATGVKAGAAGSVVGGIPLRALVPQPPRASRTALSAAQRRTLDAALARMIPAEGPDDWSAADVGAGDYIEGLLSTKNRIFAGGPFRSRFWRFQRLTRAKQLAWVREKSRLRDLYMEGLAELNRRAGGDFAARPAVAQDLILQSMDLEGNESFAALFGHTMEGVYAHPAYGGNRDYRAWKDLCYQGDVHGVRFPGIGGRKAPWNEYGGYAPEEMAKPGECPGQGPEA